LRLPDKVAGSKVAREAIENFFGLESLASEVVQTGQQRIVSVFGKGESERMTIFTSRLPLIMGERSAGLFQNGRAYRSYRPAVDRYGPDSIIDGVCWPGFVAPRLVAIVREDVEA
jgi:hypothetical protein